MEDTLKTIHTSGGRLPATAEILALDTEDSIKLKLIKSKRVFWIAFTAQIVILIIITSVSISIAVKGNLPTDSKDAYLLGLIMGVLPIAGLVAAFISTYFAGKLKVEMREVMIKDLENETQTPS